MANEQQIRILASLADLPWVVGPPGISVQRGKVIVPLTDGDPLPEAATWESFTRLHYLRTGALRLPDGHPAVDFDDLVKKVDSLADQLRGAESALSEAETKIALLQAQIGEAHVTARAAAEAEVEALRAKVLEYEELLTAAPASTDPAVGHLVSVLRTEQVLRVATLLGLRIELPEGTSAEQARALLLAAMQPTATDSVANPA